ncbi:Trafficking protein particle complex subunit 11 [Escovopsis weberi]|uniref:Trafficking protein particle complex subunit 11 n=1 Tax=Escovopsis weberi TaxID=150374 RepID=A0A0M8MQS0_ESCWE|nr:Trafficking protein particle complex subunit 11 [Escovopsis weberi]
MDGYPLGSLDHNVPLIFVSGINAAREQASSRELKDQGILIRSDLPCLDSREASFLATYLDRIDTQGLSWTAVSRDEQYRLRIKAVGRSVLLPPRRAPIPESIEPFLQLPVLHSPYSPLSPSSALYPDGLIDARWIEKHQEHIPSVIACFYSLTSDPTAIASDDNRMKSDINNIKSGLARSGYKTRLAVIILGDEETSSQSPADAILDRLEGIRRGAGLDPKSIFFIPNQESPTEFQRVIDNILGVLYGISIEYYKDLARHARKKRSRGFAPHPTVPPTSGTSQTLSLPDWNFRYDLKSAVFAEFRQENDLAIRSFEQAYETLLSQDIFDLIPSWSPRWNEARLLADIISIRCLRLHLWMGQPSMAARRWQAHRERVTYIVENQGRGTTNYGWPAWEARWAMVMAQLIERVEVHGLASPPSAIYLPPEKALLGERSKPWELLHHTGYWYRIAAVHLGKRRELARNMSEEDRGAPDASPASQVASKAYMYDTYLCPPPHKEYPLQGEGVDHSQLIIDCLIDARTQFQARKQHRMAAEVALECAKEMASQEAWGDVVALLRPIWEDSSFRSEWWLDAAEDMLWLLRRAAAGFGRADLVVAIDWELMDRRSNRIY